MQEYLVLKRMAGFKYESEGRMMEMFDQYCYDTGFSGERLNAEVVNGFCYGIYYEKASTKYRKEKLLSGLAEHLCTLGLLSYICPRKSVPKKSRFTPYLFTDEELRSLFLATDTYPPHPLSNRHIVDSIMFRMIYGCGLRLSEALNLTLKDVDIVEGTLTILQSKNNKDRRIPMAESLVNRCKKYNQEMHIFSDGNTFYFKSSLNRRLDKSAAYRRFRDYLWHAGIAHSGKGPRIHDLRHLFCINCLKRWVLAGKDLTNLFPYLSAYLGHADFRGTQYYLRLTADLYPDIISKTEAALGYIFPERTGL
ncbi:tyrosine-type recombinase/integrase [Algoriphagus resistens]|uniref:tyrosine-type recombinase/integrase n=1 Tax=Algoriphagus resistens TaxID=1750590 RepID=UPI000AA36594|nr:tyrosine-type recombinase/integrase [Algoriphagus resistens]